MRRGKAWTVATGGEGGRGAAGASSNPERVCLMVDVVASLRGDSLKALLTTAVVFQGRL